MNPLPFMPKAPLLRSNSRYLPLVLAILDGWGVAPRASQADDATALAKTPFLRELAKHYPGALLRASGEAVGLPKGQDGNSEAGHLNLGAGRIVVQDAMYISKAIHDGTFFKNQALKVAVAHVRKHRSALHLMGLLTSYNSGHTSPDHFMALLKFASQAGIRKVYLHFFTDGRDSPRYDAVKFLGEVRQRLLRGEVVASVTGRLYAMDRKKDWSRTEATYNLLTLGQGRKERTAEAALRHAYNRGESDEFVPPTAMCDSRGRPRAVVRDHDAVVLYNLRSDRARQLAKPFVQRAFERENPGSFRRRRVVRDLCFVALTDFGPDLGNIFTAFPSRDVVNSLPFALSPLRQLYVAESEKYAHVTYFFNGGYDRPVAGESRISVPSPDVLSYDATPEMAAPAITRHVLRALASKRFDVVVLNLANPDMVGHTGNLRAGVQAMECVDRCLARIARAVRAHRGTLLVTSDHGNVEEFINRSTGEVDTEHSTNPVPFLLYHSAWRGRQFPRRRGVLGDVAPTILQLLGLPKPSEMTRRSLLRA